MILEFTSNGEKAWGKFYLQYSFQKTANRWQIILNVLSQLVKLQLFQRIASIKTKEINKRSKDFHSDSFLKVFANSVSVHSKM